MVGEFVLWEWVGVGSRLWWERGRDWEVRGGAHVREQAVVWK